jgi:peptidyl-prolyl cis-trans isomerase SurA
MSASRSESFGRRMTAGILAAALFWAAAPLCADEVESVDKIAAVVGDRIILLSEVLDESKMEIEQLKRETESGGGAGAFMDGRIRTVIKNTLDAMIDDVVYDEEAKEMALGVTQEELDQTIANMAKENGIDIPALKKAVASQGMDYMGYRNQLRRQLLRFKVLNLKVRSRIKITEAEARQHYNDQVRSIRSSGSYEGAHILIRVPVGASAEDAAAAGKKIEKIQKEILDGRDFADAAREFSQDKVTAPYGGSLGMRNPGEIPGVLERVFVDMEPGEIVGPVRTASGFHLLRLNKRDSLDVMPFAEVKEKIIQDLQEEEMKRQAGIWLKERRARMFISIRL